MEPTLPKPSSLLLVLMLGATACGSADQAPHASENSGEVASQPSADATVMPQQGRGETSEPGRPGSQADTARPTPPEPGQPGGLPDDRTPVTEAPFTEDSAQGAANVVQTFFALVEAGRHEQAWQLWSTGAKANGMSAADFTASFERYQEYHARVGAPGRIEGAAGSLYVEVPVQVFGRLKGGKPFNSAGKVQLRRTNEVPGASAEQRQWRIAAVVPDGLMHPATK
jgi:hypothetical protein